MTYLLAALAAGDALIATRPVEFNDAAAARLGFGHIVAELDDDADEPREATRPTIAHE